MRQSEWCSGYEVSGKHGRCAVNYGMCSSCSAGAIYKLCREYGKTSSVLYKADSESTLRPGRCASGPDERHRIISDDFGDCQP